MIEVTSISPQQGPTYGGTVIKIAAIGLGPEAQVWLANVPTPKPLVEGGNVYVQAPAHSAGIVPITIASDGDSVTVPDAYTYCAPALAKESDMTRVVRAVMQQLKCHILRTCSISVAVECTGPGADGESAPAVASLPALVLSGPTIRENRLASVNSGAEAEAPDGTIYAYAAPRTVDLEFHLVGASASTVELLNLMSATLLFLHSTEGVSLARTPSYPELGSVTLPIDLLGEARTYLDNPDGIRSFNCGFAVRGLDLSLPEPRRVRTRAEGVNVHLITESK